MKLTEAGSKLTNLKENKMSSNLTNLKENKRSSNQVNTQNMKLEVMVIGHRSLKDRSEVHDRDDDKEMGAQVEESKSYYHPLYRLTPLPLLLSTLCSAVLTKKL